MTWLDSVARRFGLQTRANRTARRAFPARLALTALEDRTVPTTLTWLGAAGASWSSAGNWADGASNTQVPDSADDVLVFGAGAMNLTNTNDITSLSVAELQLTAAGYTIGGNAVDLATGLTDSNASGGNTLSLALTGTGGLTKSGGGTLTLSGSSANTYTGTTTVNAGTLQLGKTAGVNAFGGNLVIGDSAGTDTVLLLASDQIPNAASVTVNLGATLNLNNLNDTIGTLNLTGSTVSTGTGTLTLGGDVTTNAATTTAVISGNLDLGGATRTFTVGNNSNTDPDLTISANISGTGAGIVKAGANSNLHLSGNNSYDGSTFLSAGAMQVSSNNALGATTDETVLANGTSLLLTGGITLAAEPISLSGSGFGTLGAIWSASGNNAITGPLTFGGSTTISSSSGTTLTISGAISDGGNGYSLTLGGLAAGGTLALTGTAANTYSGSTTVSKGTLQLGKTAGVNAFAGNLVVGDNAGSDAVRLLASNQIPNAASVSVGEGATFDLSTFSDTVTNLTIQGGSVTVGTGGVLTLTGGLASNATANNVTSTISGAGALDLNGNGTFAMTVADDASVMIDARISAAIQNGGIVKSGSGILGLAGANTYAGTTAVNAGAIQAESNAALGTTAGGTTVASGASVFFSGASLTVAEDFSVVGSGYTSSGALATLSGASTLTGGVLMTANSQVGSASGATLAIDGVVSESGGARTLTVLQGSTGRTVLGGSNTYTGGTAVDAGYLRLTHANGLGDPAASTTATFADTATLELSGDVTLPATKSITLQLNGANSTDPKVINVGGNNTILGTVTFAGHEELSAASGTTLTIAGTIVETGGSRNMFTTGAGTILLTGTNGYTGGTFLGDGTLRVNSSIASSSGVFLYGAATLAGTSTVPAFTLASGGSLSPGGSPGTLSSGNATFVSGSSYSVELNGTTAGTQYDQLSVTGTVTLGGATLAVSLGYGPAIGDSFTIISNDGSDAVSGTFAGLAEGATFEIGDVEFTISYAGGTGNDVVLTVTAITFTWTGGGADADWTTAGNWAGGIAPGAGAKLVFPAGPVSTTSYNNLPVGTTFRSMTIAGTGYDIYGNGLTLTNGISSTATSGSSGVVFDITLTASETINVATGGTLNLTGAIAGSGFGVTKTGGGTLRYAGVGANTYTGTTTVNAGTLTLDKTAGVNAIGGNLVVGDNTTAAAVNFGVNDQIPNAAAVTVNEGSLFNVSGGFEQIGNLAIQGGAVTVGTGSYLRISSGHSITTLATANNQTAVISGGGLLDFELGTTTFHIADDPSVTIDARVSVAMADGSIVKSGTGTLALAGTNTYAGTTAVNAGVLQVESPAALGTTAGSTTVASGASVYFSGTGLTVAETFTDVAGTGVGGLNLFQVVAGDATLTGSVTLTTGISLGAADGTTLTVNGVIDDGASVFDLVVANGATGRVVLGGNNLFDGSVNVASGYLRITHSNGLGDPAAAANVTAGADYTTLELAGGVTLPATKTVAISGVPVPGVSKIMSFGGDNAILGDIPITGGNNVAIDVDGATDLTVGGVISGALDLDKNGSGRLIVTGTNTHMGRMNSFGGTLIVNGSFATSSSLIVGAVLGGSGAVAPVLVLNGGTLAPGSSPAALAAAGLEFETGATYRVELDGTTAGTQYDQANVTGTVTLADATLDVTLGYTPAVGDTFTIISNDGSDAVTGTFAGLTEGSLITHGGTTLRISYVGGTGNDVVLTAVETPTVTGTASANPSTFGAAVTFCVTVAGNGLPTGDVTLVIDGSNVETVALASGTASFAPIDNLTIGTHTVAFEYAGDASNLPSSGTLTGGQVVDKAITLAAVVPSTNPSVVGQAVTFTATVTSVAGTPTGTVTFRNATTGLTLGSVALNGSGVATVTTSELAVGTSRIEVEYSGDVLHAASTGFVNQTVSAIPVPPPTPPVVVSVGAGSSADGTVRLFNLTTGRPATEVQAYPGYAGEIRVATGDVTGDGVADTITAVGDGPTGGHVKVFDGVTGELRSSFYAFPGFSGGVFVTSGDVNGDGYADIIAAAGPGGGPHVKVFSGRDGSELFSFMAYDQAFGGGVHVAAGDVDGDGRTDIITGAGAGGAPHVKAFSGADLTLLRSFFAYDSGFTGGVYVGAGDFDGDGRTDIVTGAGAGGAPHVEVFSGKDSTVLSSFLAFSPGFQGGVRVGSTVIDGVRAILAGAGLGGGPHVRAFDLHGNPLRSFYAGDADVFGGVYVG